MRIDNPSISGSLSFIGGNNSISATSVNLTGSFSGSVVGTFEGAFSSTATANISGAFDSVSSSLASRIASQESFSSSLDSTFATDTDVTAVSNRVGTLEGKTLVSSSVQIASDISGSFNSLSSSLASELLKNTTDTLTGNLTVTGTITAQDLHVQEVTSSIVYSSGSNIFGTDSSNTQILYGSIGIGTASPVSLLHVYGTGNSVVNVTAGVSNYATLQFGSTGDSTRGAVEYYTGDDSLRLKTGNNSEVVRIESSGNVGIGTTTTNALLVVSGSVTQNSNNPGIELSNSHASQTVLLIKNTTSRKYELAVGGTSNTVGNGAFYIYDGTADAARFVLDSSGNVGIGNTTPSSYHANASNLVVGDSGNAGISIVGGTTGRSTLHFADGTSGGDESRGYIVYRHTENDMLFGTDDATAVAIDSSQDIGIGTTSPFSKLSVNSNGAPSTSGNVATTGLTVHNEGTGTSIQMGTYDAGTYGYIQSAYVNNAGVARQLRFYVGATPAALLTTSTNAFFNYTNTTIESYGSGAYGGKVVIKASGAEGLALLNNSIGGTSQVTLSFVNEFVSNQYNYLGRIIAEPEQSWTGTASTRSSRLMFYTNSAGYIGERMRITSGGYVGIGTNDPGSRKLAVHKNTAITAGFNDISEFLDTTLGVGGSVSLNIGKENATKNLGKMAFKYAGDNSNSNSINWGFYDADNLITLLANGNVGINTTSPDEKLHVNGNVAVINSSYPTFKVQGSDVNYQGRMRWDTNNNYLEFLTRYGGTYYSTLILDRNKVLIGTDEQAGSGQLTIGISDSDGGRLALTNLRDALFDGDSLGRIEFVSKDTTSTGVKAMIIARTEDVSANTNLQFHTGGGTLTERMRIESGGGVIVNGNSSDHVTAASHFAVKGNGTTYTGPASNSVSQITVENSNTSNATGHAILLLRSNVGGTSSTGANAGNTFISFDSYNFGGWTAGVDYTDNTNFKITTSWSDVSGTGVELVYNSTSWQANSDERLKENIVNIGTVLDKIDNIRCVKYNFISEEEMPTQYGFIAQDWQEDFSEVLSVSNAPNSPVENKLSMKYTETIPILMKAIQELKEIVDQQQAEINALKNP